MSDEPIAGGIVLRLKQLEYLERWLSNDATRMRDYIRSNPTHGCVEHFRECAEVTDTILTPVRKGIRLLHGSETDVIVLNVKPNVSGGSQ